MKDKPAESLQFDHQQAELFLQLLGKDPAKTRIRGFFEKHDPRKAGDHGRKASYSRQRVQQWVSEGRGIYVVINDGGDKAEQITGCRALFNEWDDQPREWQLTAWQSLGLPAPTCQVDTGRQSIHTYWRLQQLIDREQFTSIQKRLVAHGNSDNLKDPSRVMRLPGCPRGDGAREMVRLIWTPPADGQPLQHSVQELDARLPQLPAPKPAAVAPRQQPTAPAGPSTAQAGDLPPRGMDQIREALNCIPRRQPGNGNYLAPLGDRDMLWGLVAAVQDAGGTIEEAIDLMEAHSPSAACKWPVEQVAWSGNGSKTAATFWAIAKANGFDTRRHDLQRPAPEPPEGTPAQQAPWGQGDTPAELQGPRQRVASFQSLIQQLEKGWRWNEKEAVYKAAALSAGKLASLLPADALRFNEMTLRGEVQTRNGWQQITDADLDSAYVVLTDLGWRIGPEIVVKAVMHAARQAPHHPVRDYLQRVAADSSITPFDLDQVAPRFFRATKPLHVAMVRAWLIGAAARALKPGCQMDYCLVLQSDAQGLRKSRTLEALASPDWYCSTIPEAEKDLLLNIHSTWIYELAELESVTSRKEAGRLKNLITTSTDVLRVPYGRTSERMPRQSVLCATVNEDTFLRDDTGNRRFWVVPIDGSEQLDHGGLIAARDAIWKAAVLAHREGELPMLAPELERESEQQNEQFNAQDSWDAMVLAWMDGEPLHRWDPERDPSTTPYNPNETFSSAEVLYSAGLRRPDQITRADEMRVAAVLKRLGFTKKQGTAHGKRLRYWSAPLPSQPRPRSQPSQPLSDEVGMAQSHCSARDLSRSSQPSQPFSSEKGINKGGSAPAPAVENDPPFGNRGWDAPPSTPRPTAAQPVSASQPLSDEVGMQPEVVKLPAPIPPHAPLPACDWLHLVLQLREANPGALPAELANLLQAHHHITTSGREVRDQLAAWDRQQQLMEVA